MSRLHDVVRLSIQYSLSTLAQTDALTNNNIFTCVNSQILSDQSRLIRRTQLRRSAYHVLGQVEPAAVEVKPLEGEVGISGHISPSSHVQLVAPLLDATCSNNVTGSEAIDGQLKGL